jgi:hypothetical protein
MRVNTRFAGVLLTLVVVMSGCGSEGGSPPVLTGVVRPRTLPVRYMFNFNDGEAPLAGEVGFEDPDGDVVLLSVTWPDCGSGTAKRLEIVQEDLKGTRTGQIPFVLVISTNCPIGGPYHVYLSVTDGQGHVSNDLDVTYEIYAPLE